MLNIAIGVILLVVTVILFKWGVPREGQPSRVPSKWGMATAFPMVLVILGVAGLAFVAKGFFP